MGRLDTDPVATLEHHLQRVEALEKKQRRQRWATLVLSMVSLCIIGMIIFGPDKEVSPEKPYVVWPADVENTDELATLLSRGKAAVILEDPETLSRDTLRKLDDLRQWRQRYGAAYAFTAATRSSQEEEEPSMPAALATPQLIIVGKKMVDQRLVFAIKNYQPDLEYSLDFDNGYVQDGVGMRSVYAYNISGSFEVGLTVKGKSGEQKRSVQEIDIAPALSPKNGEADLPLLSDAEGEEVQVEEQEAEATSEEIVPTSQPDTSSAHRREKTSLPSSEEEVPAAISTAPLQVSETMPSFPGGEEALFAYIDKNLRYPQKALDREIEGRLYVQFVVQADGRLTDFRVLRGLGYGCDSEALRIISEMPRWNPGKQKGKAVPVYYTLPITYDIK